MEAILSKHCFVSALSRLSGIADRKSSMPILSNVYISTEGSSSIVFAATDLNISARGVFPAQIVRPGTITLPAKTLHDIVKSLPEGDILLRAEGDSVEVSSGRSNFTLLGLPAEDFPTFPDTVEVDYLEFNTQLLGQLIDRTSFSISSDESRPHLNGALFQGDAKILRMVTTDGHRLSKAEFKAEETGFYNFSHVVSHKGILELRRLLDDSLSVISMGFHAGTLFVKRTLEVEKPVEGEPTPTAEFVLASKLVEAEFPSYDQVIPKGMEREVIAPRVALLESLRRISIVSPDRNMAVKFAISEGSIEISSNNPAVGTAVEVIDVTYDGDEVEIGFNVRYFADALSVLSDDEVKLELSGALDPAVINDLESTFVGVIMPMRI
ncbi:MAG: DNA polymerase III subunit beta [Proteobacteria bacterium]|nr:DNA polymerase III subunit beta [Pseudomonadota bacterium]